MQPGPTGQALPHQANGPGPAPRSGTGPETPRVPEEGMLRADSRGLGPPIGVWDLPRPSGPPTRVEPTYRRGGRSRHVSRRHGRESSAGRLAHPPHLMWVVEARSTAAARVAAFVRSHCRPRITEVHSAATCAASTQGPSGALIGYDDTTLFHHAAYDASYTARSAAWQATLQATPGAVSTSQRLDMLNGGFQEQARNSRERSPLPAMP